MILVVAATPLTQCDSQQPQEGSSNIEEVSKVDSEASRGLPHHCSGDEENDGETGLDDDKDSGNGIWERRRCCAVKGTRLVNTQERSKRSNANPSLLKMTRTSLLLLLLLGGGLRMCSRQWHDCRW